MSLEFYTELLYPMVLKGCYKLDDNNIDNIKRESPNINNDKICGVYALGKIENDEFLCYYVGRSMDLKKRLKEHILNGKITDDRKKEYEVFYYKELIDDINAYYDESRLYHYFKEKINHLLKNDNHPAKPEYFYSIRCPICKK